MDCFDTTESATNCWLELVRDISSAVQSGSAAVNILDEAAIEPDSRGEVVTNCRSAVAKSFVPLIALWFGVIMG
jgi:hypothetical protein